MVSATKTPVQYDDSIAKGFVISALVWGVVGLSAGLWIALTLIFPGINFGLEFLTFGRFRAIHTGAIIYGFVLSAIFASWYFMAQRLLKVSLLWKKVGQFHLFLFNLIIVLAAVSVILGVTTSRRYNEFEWPIAVLIVVMWLSWGLHMFGMIAARREKTLYITIWYYIACFLGVGMVYLFNNAEIPSYFIAGQGSFLHSVSMYSGVNSGNVQWWFGHNAVAFVLTVPIVGIAYYSIPKRANQPVYSYRLSLWSFWGLIFIYLWAGPHHLLFSSLPDWIQTLGMLFSLLLILPSWGSMINLLLTASGKWDLLRTDPIFKYLIIGSTFYGLSTLEGPIQAIRSVNALSHFTDWMVGHVHSGALGWVGFMLIGSLYMYVPVMWKKQLYSTKIAESQFWIQTLGIVLYAVSLWIAGITQGMMWRATDSYGSLAYSFLDTISSLAPYYILRALGGGLYLVGFIMFMYNITKTIKSGKPAV